jgi:hypothetical protein
MRFITWFLAYFATNLVIGAAALGVTAWLFKKWPPAGLLGMFGGMAIAFALDRARRKVSKPLEAKG